MKYLFFITILIFACGSSTPDQDLHLYSVTQKEFLKFQKETGYKTTSEVYGSSWCQESWIDYNICKSNVTTEHYKKLAVHVSKVDAQHFCKWKNARLPTLQEYWKYSTPQHRRDVWDWTTDGVLAGGSYFCRKKLCSGYIQGNEKKMTDNLYSSNHVGFCYLK